EDTYDLAASLAIDIMDRTSALVLPDYSVININYPMTDRALGVKAVPLRLTRYDDYYVEVRLRDGRTGYRLEGSMVPIPEPQEDDYSWLSRGYATVTVLTHEMTDREMTTQIRALVE
ncbi:MAG: hypothetical protein IJT77_09170, partial [Clostridia bacterium]|nr:hypothetical protein [Clostridia bacterium]